jgi:hypothetical protein
MQMKLTAKRWSVTRDDYRKIAAATPPFDRRG